MQQVPLTAVFAFIGLFLSLYAFRIQKHLKRIPSYKPICDLSDRVSCSRALTSKESALLFLPNSFYGMFYYFILIICISESLILYAHILSTLALLVSMYLAYILYFKQKNFCLVCWAVHVINVVLFVLLLFQNM